MRLFTASVPPGNVRAVFDLRFRSIQFIRLGDKWPALQSGGLFWFPACAALWLFVPPTFGF